MAGPEAGPVQVQPRPVAPDIGGAFNEYGRIRHENAVNKKTLSPEQKSERLFSKGTVQEALLERMNRIGAYDKWIKAGRDEDHRDISPHSINPYEEGISDDEKNKRLEEESHRDRMIRLIHTYKNEQNLEEHIKDNFFDLQKWIGVILKNSKQSGGNLTLDDKSYKAFKILKNIKVENFWENREKFLKYLKDYRFLDYFSGDADFISYTYDEDGSRQPISLEGNMESIAEDYYNSDFKPGGKYELLDKQGEFHLDNFLTWVRIMTYEQSSFSPTSALDLLGRDALKYRAKGAWGHIILFDALFEKSLRMQHRDFVLSGSLSDGVNAEWGELKEYPGLNKKIREEILTEMWFTGLGQTGWAELKKAAIEGNIEKYLEVFSALSNANNEARYKYGDNSLMMTANGKDNAQDCLQNNKRGTLGRAYANGLAFFRHFTEMTDFYFDKKAGRVRGFGDNMAYRQLGPVGSDYFLQSITENSLNSQNNLGNQIKIKYYTHIFNIINDLENIAHNQSDAKHNNDINNLVLNAKKSLYDKWKSNNLSVSFEGNETLTELWQELQQVMGRKLVSQKNMQKYGYSPEDGFVTFEDSEQYIQQKMREGLGNFLGSILDTESEGGSHLGDMEVYVVNGRIVNEEECKIAMGIDKNGLIPKSDLNGSGIVTIEEIVNDYMDNYKEDMLAIDIIKEYEQTNGAIVGDDVSKEDDYQEAKARIKDILKRQERLGFAMLDKVAGLSRKDLNTFSKHMPSAEAKKILDESMIKSLMEKYGLNHDEVKYLYKTRILYFLAQSGVEAWLNTSRSRTGINPLSKLNRNSVYGLSDHSLGRFNEIRTILSYMPPTMFDAVMVDVGKKKIPLLDYLQGDYDISEGSLSYQHQSFWAKVLEKANAMEQFLAAKQLFIESSFITTGQLGQTVVDHEKLEKGLGEIYNAARHAFDYGGYDYKQVVRVDGEDMTLLEHMFTDKTIEIIELMKKDWESKSKSMFLSEEKKNIYAKFAKEIDQKPAAGVFMSVLMDMIRERTSFRGHFQKMDTGDAKIMEYAIKYYFRKLAEDVSMPELRYGARDIPPLVDENLFRRLMKVHGHSMESLNFLEWLYIVFALTLSIPRHVIKD